MRFLDFGAQGLRRLQRRDPWRGSPAILKPSVRLREPALFVSFRKPKHVSLSFKTNKPRRFHVWVLGCGGRGIRTPGGVTLNSFQDCRIRPLCHSSIAAANITKLFIKITAFFKFLNPLQSLKRDFWVMVRASLFLSENSYLPVYIRMPE